MKPYYKPPAEGHGREEIVGPVSRCTLGFAAQKILAHVEVARSLRDQCESPIEIDLGAYLLRLLKGTRVTVQPQYRWGPFRMDFACLVGELPVLFIECDGKDFHSTPAQLANDRDKDRRAKIAGIPLMRFTGSDIFRQAEACAKLAINAIEHHLR